MYIVQEDHHGEQDASTIIQQPTNVPISGETENDTLVPKVSNRRY